jgi:ABC-type nickel/cobalt efflux system permease component RcnA
MSKRARLVSLLVVIAFAAFLLWSTLSSQHVECTVTVAFQSGQGTAVASAASEEDAIRQAQTAACGPLAQGMNDQIACGRTPPVSTRCRTL